MANPPIQFDYQLYDKLYAELGSQNAVFRRMGVNRSTGQRAVERREKAVATFRNVEVLPTQPSLPSQSEVPAVLDDLKEDLIEMVTWWRHRKLCQTQPRQARDMVRWTIHIDRRWRDGIMELSDAQRTSIADVVDDICRHYFERTL